jgi:DNA-3-methyladenine glycosylase
MAILQRKFFESSALVVARDLIGCTLVRCFESERVSGIISETEAYQGEDDLACHAHVGKTARNALMYGISGIAYIYFTYGMHWLLNVVTDQPGFPSAVLIRAVIPKEGLELLETNRPKDAYKKEWLNGPAKITQAFNINGLLNGEDLCKEDSQLWIERSEKSDQPEIVTLPRVGLFSVPEPWKSVKWRFVTKTTGAVFL